MKFTEASSTIAAPPEAVWAVLTDGSGFTAWPSGIERFGGEIRSGGTVKLYSEVSPGRAFPLKVVELVPVERMVWQGGMPLGLLTGRRTFTLVPQGAATLFTMREEFTGPLVPLMWRSMPDLAPSFRKFADGLKARVESRSKSEGRG